MSLFGYEPNISEKEFMQVRADLRQKRFTPREIKEVEKIFRGDMKEDGAQRGIDRNELKKGIDWMKKNLSSHRIPRKKIDILEEELIKKLSK
jgi:Ca2+-binding EF-hand superfamily protein